MAICKQDGGLCGVGGYCDDCTAGDDEEYVQWIYLPPEKRQEVQDAKNALWKQMLDNAYLAIK